MADQIVQKIETKNQFCLGLFGENLNINFFVFLFKFKINWRLYEIQL